MLPSNASYETEVDTFNTVAVASVSVKGKFNTNVQDCHKMSKLYLVHLRPLGLHGIFLVVLSIQVAVVPSCHGTTWNI